MNDEKSMVDTKEQHIEYNKSTDADSQVGSNEIRTLVHVMLVMNEMISRECKDANIRAYSETIRSAGNTLLELTEHGPEPSAAGAGKLEAAPVSDDLSSMIHDLAQMIQKKTDEKGPVSHRVLSSEGTQFKEKLSAPDAHVLVADDNPMNLLVFQSLLSRTHIHIDTADNGYEALKLACDKKYDMIFLDHMMPDKDGIETMQDLRAMEKSQNLDTPIVCLAANTISRAREQYIAKGFDDYLSKPVDYLKLEEMLIKYLPDEKVEIMQTEEEGIQGNFSGRELPAPLAALRGQELINVEEGMKNSGSADAYIALLQIFNQLIGDMISEIERLHAAGDIKGYTVKVHALKNSAKTIGAAELGEQAQKLESAGKSGDMGYIRKNHDGFIIDCRQHENILEAVFETDKDIDPDDIDNKEDADESMVVDFYSEMKLAAEDMDYDQIEELLEYMNEYTVPSEEEDTFQEIKALADQFEYRRIAKILEERGI